MLLGLDLPLVVRGEGLDLWRFANWLLNGERGMIAGELKLELCMDWFHCQSNGAVGRKTGVV